MSKSDSGPQMSMPSVRLSEQDRRRAADDAEGGRSGEGLSQSGEQLLDAGFLDHGRGGRRLAGFDVTGRQLDGLGDVDLAAVLPRAFLVVAIHAMAQAERRRRRRLRQASALA